MDIDKERAAFEAWARPKWKNPACWERVIGDATGLKYNDYFLQAASDGWQARAALASQDTAPPAAVPASCTHRIVDARNPVVTSGYICVDCGALFAAADHGTPKAAPAQAVDALGIKTWEERVKECGLPASDVVYEAAMRAEIVALRAALDAQPAAPAYIRPDELKIMGRHHDGSKPDIELPIFGDGSSDGKRLFLVALPKPDAPAGEPVAKQKPVPYVLGNQYQTQSGEWVRLVTVANQGTIHESMACEKGIHRYTNREGDYGRVTASAHDYSCRDNIPPLYAAPVANAGQKVASSGGKVASEHATLGAQAQPVYRALFERQQSEWTALANAAGFQNITSALKSLGRQAQAVAVPDGWRLVPVKPTIEMHNAAALQGLCGTLPTLVDGRIEWAPPDASAVYAAMLAAAPLPQQVAQCRGCGQTDEAKRCPGCQEKISGVVLTPNSRTAYADMSPEAKRNFDAQMNQLEKHIAERNQSRDRRTHDEPVETERRHGDRRHNRD